MDFQIEEQIALLQQMTVAQLQGRYEDVFEEPPRSRHKRYLIRRIAWRIQALAEGDLSDRARRRAAELACDADLRLAGPAVLSAPAEPPKFARFRSRRRPLPAAGTTLTRHYQGRAIEVTVLPSGFQYAGHTYRSLSAVAKAVTGSHWNGYHFFGLHKPARQVNCQ